MFDIGFSELVVIGIVALVVLGPERLPSVARTVGHLLGRMQRYVNQVKSDLNRELELEELRKLQSQVITSAHELEANVRQEIDSARSAFDVQDAPTDATALPPEQIQELASPAPPPTALPFEDDAPQSTDQGKSAA
jgi:sec-independent protein translocase protein TatB